MKAGLKWSPWAPEDQVPAVTVAHSFGWGRLGPSLMEPGGPTAALSSRSVPAEDSVGDGGRSESCLQLGTSFSLSLTLLSGVSRIPPTWQGRRKVKCSDLGGSAPEAGKHSLDILVKMPFLSPWLGHLPAFKIKLFFNPHLEMLF